MRFDDIQAFFNENKTTIVGANVEEIENAEFNMLTALKFGVKYSDEDFEILKAFEQKIVELYDIASGKGLKEETMIHPMQVENGKVKMYDGQIYHRCNPSMQTLKGISVGGVLASEWFGKRESEGEGFLCAFAAKRITTGQEVRDNFDRNWRRPKRNQCFLYFDEKNPLMQALEKIDYFEYEHQKSILTKEELEKRYSPGMIKLFDQLIEPMSSAGKNFHSDSSKMSYGWLAIPGGIPSQLINGIHLSTDCEIMQGT
ncbi:MAG: hypothetical protein K6F08_01670, partial [bacterium]|nr:hypothetical protein [bacterium]